MKTNLLCAAALLLSTTGFAQTNKAWEFGGVLDLTHTTRPLAAGMRDQGLQLGHSDLTASGPLGRHLRGHVGAVFETHDGKLEKGFEEVFIETTSLPYGLQARAGRFASQIGYLNQQHMHADDFTERPLLYRAFFGGHWNDDGVRLNLTLPTSFYWMVGAEAMRGKNVIIGASFFESADFFHMPFHGKVPGAYFHIMGAHTLKRAVPVDLFWYPALLIAVAAIAVGALFRWRSSRSLWLAALGLSVLTFFLDEANVNIDIMSGLLALGFAAIGFSRIRRKYYSSEVDAMTTSALSLEKTSAELDVYALKIANLAEMSEDWGERELGEFVNTLITYVKGPGVAGDVAFERDSLVWLTPRMETASLERHADGLALMLKTAISHDWQSASSSPAIGVDTNHDLPLAQRIKKAMQAADEAASRGARFVLNDAAYVEARNHRLEIIRVLEKGLRERSIGVAYQPKIDLATGRIVGAETLIRWRPDGLNYVNPQELVLAAEANDRINELTLIVMEAALTEGRKAIALDPLFKLAVNMSAKSLSDTHLLFDMMTILGRIGFPPGNLTLELTETAKLEDKLIAPQIAALKARGIGLSIDDFGTGQSNLEYLQKLPSDELKIDKKFVQHMDSSEESRAVVRATIEIAHSLGKVVVAEGVETQDVAATLRGMGCDQAQGYLFSRAIAMHELLAMIGGGKITVNG